MRVVLIVVVIIVVIFSKIERRRVWRQGNSSLTLYSVLPAETVTRSSVLQHCPYGLKNASSGDKESRNQVHKGTLQEKFKVETLSC